MSRIPHVACRTSLVFSLARWRASCPLRSDGALAVGFRGNDRSVAPRLLYPTTQPPNHLTTQPPNLEVRVPLFQMFRTELRIPVLQLPNATAAYRPNGSSCGSANRTARDSRRTGHLRGLTGLSFWTSGVPPSTRRYFRKVDNSCIIHFAERPP